MSEPYQPLFNRTYLQIVMWLSAFAVLYLATMGSQEPDYLELNRAEKHPIYWVENESEQTNLAVLLPTGGALTRSEKQLQTLLSQVLENQMAAQILPEGIEYQLQQAPDQLILTFQWKDQDNLPDWSSLFSGLLSPIEASRWQPVLEKLKARDYLQSHKTNNQLLNSYFQQLTGGELNDPLALLNSRYQSMLNNARFFISGNDSDELAEQLMEHPPRLAPTTRPDRNIARSQQEKILPSGNDRRYHLLVGAEIPVRNSADFIVHKLAAHTLQTALAQTSTSLKFEYRQLWSSLEDVGYRALLLHADQPLDNLMQALENQITPELAENSRNQVINQWRERMTDEHNQISALQQVAFYGLPADTLNTYSERLGSVEISDIVKLAKASVQPDNQIRIRLANRTSAN